MGALDIPGKSNKPKVWYHSWERPFLVTVTSHQHLTRTRFHDCNLSINNIQTNVKGKNYDNSLKLWWVLKLKVIQ